MIAIDNLVTTDPDELAGIAEQFAHLSAPQALLMAWAAEGSLKVTCLQQPDSPMPRHVGTGDLPEIVIIGDDPATGFGSSLGPDGWRCVGRLRQFKPAAALIHATGATPADYSHAGVEATSCGRFLLIECDSTKAEAWVDLVHHWCPAIVFLPSDGVHPKWRTVH